MLAQENTEIAERIWGKLQNINHQLAKAELKHEEKLSIQNPLLEAMNEFDNFVNKFEELEREVLLRESKEE